MSLWLETMASESNDKKRGRWDGYEWFLAGIDNLVEEANRAKGLTRDDTAIKKLDGYIECASQMRAAVMNKWGEEARKCKACAKPIFRRKGKHFCSDRCQTDWKNKTDKAAIRDKMAMASDNLAPAMLDG